ncbi:glycosyltransferase family 39 protein [Bizionia gelidisalsuginis]|uniref:Glycosyltransferase family 39 protein n=1 Tax=Bizionia gelidisalsuginis TaxID=291188 RepID=A0ABY3MD94_9FLAO|nr:glycosyltransferase family 39 protein [Bizionia gelidisalsuginis]TYC16314.1 glycosyltransferase family 39 protein [Bizionia gelidisalsuginis]
MKHPIEIVITVTIGYLLAVFQYAFNRSLWLDEAKLALNIIDKNYLELTDPLHSVQVAPVLYLWITKFFTSILGNSEYGLRLFPLVCFFISVILMIKVARQLTSNRVVIWFVTALFCLSPTLIFYASEVKQYGVDVMVVLLLYYLFFKPYKDEKTKLITLSLVGALCIFLSNISVIVLFTIGLYVLFFQRKSLKTLLIPGFVWLFAFGVYFILFVYNHPSTAGMQKYWTDAFMPTNPFSYEFWRWGLFTLKHIFTYVLGGTSQLVLYGVIAISFFMGLYFILKDKAYTLLFFIFVPIATHLILSALKLYPFSTRLLVYQVPLYVLVLGYGLGRLYSEGAKHYKKEVVATVAALPILIYVVILSFKLPYQKEHVRPIYQFVTDNIEVNEHIYIYSGNRNAYEYYSQIGVVNFKNKVILGANNRKDFSLHNQQLATLKGRVWLVFSHKYKSKTSKALEEDYILNYLKEKGGVVINLIEKENASLYLMAMH